MQNNEKINHKNKFIKDPIYGEIYIGEDDYWFYDLINTREFKRLKFIRQLGEAFNVFYSAIHTRFNHSIGVYWLTKKFLENLKPDIPKKDYIAILIAGLLHDVGHGPRSHSFESISNGFNHEDMTCQIILNEKSEINKVLKKHKVNINMVVDIIKHQNVPNYYFQIISSQIDSDRLDYIVRDAYFIGFNSLINVDIVIRWSLIIDNNLVFLNKAINSIESILFTRYQMFQQIYLNNKVLCYEQIVISIIKRLIFLYQSNYKFVDSNNLMYLIKPILESKSYDYETFIQFNDENFDTLLFSLFNEKDDILIKLLNSYFYKNEFLCTANKNIPNQKASNFYYNEFSVTKELFDNNDNQILIYNELANQKNDQKLKNITSYSKWLQNWKSNKITYYFLLKK